MSAVSNTVKSTFCMLVLVNLLGMAGTSVAADHRTLQVTAHSVTRETDYTLGSIARQHITLQVPAGFTLDASSLPAPAQNEAIELREVHWTHTDTANGRQIDLDIDWQIFVAGDTVKTMPLKNLHLEFTREQQRLTVDVPADKVIVSSLLPARIDAAHVQLYPDVPLPSWPLAGQLWALAGWLCLLATGVLYWLWYAGWIQLPREKQMPFRQAWRSIRALKEGHHEAALQAMRLISRAVDQRAGYAVTTENLAGWLATQQALAAHAQALQTFYQDLQQAFFAGRPTLLSLADLKRLAKQLSLVEVS